MYSLLKKCDVDSREKESEMSNSFASSSEGVGIPHLKNPCSISDNKKNISKEYKPQLRTKGNHLISWL